LYISELRREIQANLCGNIGVLQDQCTLKILTAVEPGTEDKMAFQQRVGLLE